jgi:putative nucleotidyltransferase with HDIG domain
VKRLYNEAVSAAENIWQSAQVEGQPDVAIARSMIDGLAQAVSQNRSALLALTTLKNYDNYTFTHMVNVSILTMGQARTFAIDGPLLREFGLAALMHDIGKVRTPIDILNKPDKLTDQEFAIMKRHTIEGAEILRATPEVPTLAPVLAFEHHLRLDGSGYPTNIKRPTINLATLLCSIADVYDAMRSQRAYQKAFPTDRILEVLRGGERQLFDQHLVRRFVQLIGIYPVGNVVRLDTGALAIVTRVHAPDPHRPSVKVISDTTGTPLAAPYDLYLW